MSPSKAAIPSWSGCWSAPIPPGPHPAIVLLPGSGPGTFAHPFWKIHTNVFVRRGFTVLSYDKRGAGDSEGDLRTTTFQDLINDGAAAVAFLRSRSDIIPGQIGLFGTSESGWFTPEIAEIVDDVAFIVNRSSPPQPWVEINLFEVKNEALDADIQGETWRKSFSFTAGFGSSISTLPRTKPLPMALSVMRSMPYWPISRIG